MRSELIAAIGALLIGVAGVAGVAAAADFAAGDLVIRDPWSRATVGAVRNGVIYLTIANRGDMPDRLAAVTTPVAGMASLHQTTTESGVMKMRPVAAIEIAPGETAVLAPGGLHIMLMRLARPLREGESFAAELVFARAGTVRIEVRVAGPGALHGGVTGPE